MGCVSNGQMFDPRLTPPPPPGGCSNQLTLMPPVRILLGDKTSAEILVAEKKRTRSEITNTCR